MEINLGGKILILKVMTFSQCYTQQCYGEQKTLVNQEIFKQSGERILPNLHTILVEYELSEEEKVVYDQIETGTHPELDTKCILVKFTRERQQLNGKFSEGRPTKYDLCIQKILDLRKGKIKTEICQPSQTNLQVGRLIREETKYQESLKLESDDYNDAPSELTYQHYLPQINPKKPFKFIIFSQHLSVLELFENEFARLKIQTVSLTGKVTDEARKLAIDKFRNDEKVEIFLLSFFLWWCWSKFATSNLWFFIRSMVESSA